MYTSVHTHTKYSQPAALIRKCVAVCAPACALLSQSGWMEEEGGRNCAVNVWRIEQRGASSVAKAVN